MYEKITSKDDERTFLEYEEDFSDIAYNIVGVQPMQMPTGLIFAMRFVRYDVSDGLPQCNHVSS